MYRSYWHAIQINYSAANRIRNVLKLLRRLKELRNFTTRTPQKITKQNMFHEDSTAAGGDDGLGTASTLRDSLLQPLVLSMLLPPRLSSFHDHSLSYSTGSHSEKNLFPFYQEKQKLSLTWMPSIDRIYSQPNLTNLLPTPAAPSHLQPHRATTL